MVDNPLAYYRRARGRQAFVRAEGLAREGKAAEAAEAYDQAAALAGDDLDFKRAAVLAAAELYETLGRASETADRAEQLADLSPSDADAILRLAKARDIIGRRDDAAAAWARRLELAPDCETAPRRLADLFSGAAAIPYLRILADRAPDDLPAWIRLGEALTAEGDFDGAAQAWTRRLLMAPDCDEAPRRLADLLRGAAALPHIRTLAERAPADLTAWTRLGQAADAVGDVGTAAIGWRRVAELVPDDLAVRRRLISLLTEMGRHADVSKQLEAAITLEPGDAGLWKALARARRSLGDTEGELRGWTGATEAAPDKPGFRREVARLLLAAGRKVDAAPHLALLSDQQPDDIDAARHAARVLQEIGETDPAARFWSRAVALDGDDIEAHRALAAWRRARQEPAEALPHLRFEADRVGGAKAFKVLALTLDQLGDTDGAEAAWRRLLAVNPVHADALARVVALSRKRGAPEAAVEVLQAAVDAAPQDPALLDQLVEAQLEARDPAGAVESRRRRAMALPDETRPLLDLVRLQIKTGDNVGAIATLQAAVEARPGDLEILRTLVQRRTKSGDVVGAISNLQRAVDANPDDVELLQSLVKLQVGAGHGDGAVANLQRAVAARTDDLDLIRHLVRLQAKLDDPSGAIASLHRAADANPAALQLVVDLAPRLQGDREGLAGLLDRAAQASPDAPPLLRGLARSAGERGDAERAVTLWSHLLKVSPGDPEAARAVGMHLYDIGERIAAAPHLAVAGAAAPTDIKVWRRLAWARRGEENLEAEAEVLSHLLAHITPDDDETKLRLIEVLIDSDRRAEAEPLLAEMADKRRDDIRLRTALARARRDLGDDAGALEAWRQVLQVNPADPDANNAVGEALLLSGDLTTAIDHIARAAPAATKPAVVWHRVAKLRRQAKDHEAELIALQNLVATAAVKDMTHHRRLAMLLEAHGRHGEAEPYLAFITEQKPTDLSALRRLAYARHVKGDIDGEAEVWARLLEQQPGAPDAVLGLARHRVGRGELEEATALLTEAGEAATAELWGELAAAHAERSQTAAEIEAWRRALALEPGLLAGHLRLAELLVGLGEGAAAAPHLAIAVEAAPDDHRLREHYGVVLHGAGRLVEAATHFAAAARARPTSPKPWKRLGRALAEAGDLEGAVTAWRHVLTLGADDQEASEALGRLLQRLGRFDEAATFLRGREGPTIAALTEMEDAFARLGTLQGAFARADLKVLDVGARGGPLDWMTLLAPFATYFACEPEAAEADRLAQALQAAHPWRDVHVIREGLGAEAGEATLHLTAHSGFSSIYPPDSGMAARFGLSDEMEVTGATAIPVITLSEAAARYGFEDLGLLKIDTQGSELDVLRGGETLLRDSVQAVYAEVEFRAFYEGQPLFGDVDAYLRGLGFELLRLEPVSRRRLTPGRRLAYSRHEVTWAHALYFKSAPDAAGLAPDLFLRRTLQQVAVAMAYELFDLAADLALAPEAQAAFAQAGLEVSLDDIDAFAQTGLARSLLRDFAQRWPELIKNTPKPYTG